MAQYGTSREFSVQTTIFGDFQRLQFLGSSFDSEDKTQSIGIENAIVLDQTILNASVRNIRYSNNSLASWSEWPAHLGVTQGFEFESGVRLKVTGSTEYLSRYGFYPSGRISSEFPVQPKQILFFELQAIPKLPSIQDRLYVTPTFSGNPNVSPEMVYALVGGFEDRASWIQTKSQIRAEQRIDVIIPNYDGFPVITLENAGTAQFLSLSETARVKLNPALQISADVMASYSKLEKTGLPYPRLPYLSAGGSIILIPRDWITLETQGKWMGRSNEAGPDLPAFALLGEKISISAIEDLKITLGLDNLLDSRIEMIRGYPLPGRMAYASLEMKF
jgi:outer membrane cobalamin receptor